MEPICSTDYLAAIPHAPVVGFVEPDKKPGAELLLKLPKLASPRPMSDHAFHQRVAADFSLIALVIAAVIVVVTVILNWSW